MGSSNYETDVVQAMFQRLLPVNGEIPAVDGRRAPRKSRAAAESVGNKIEPLLSIVEAAKQCGVSRHRIDDAINSGELAFYPIGEKARKVKASDIVQWLETKRTTIGGVL